MTLPQPSKYPGPVRLLLGAFVLLSGLGKALDVAQFPLAQIPLGVEGSPFAEWFFGFQP